ncbi:class I SAM-dependent methyltransferase [Patescibacteria group bacterium]|nr:class I SAM-dependent methyltransferase [Patescibacteria group bacterium]
MKPNEQENIYTDDVDYANTPDDSVWGTEDKATNDLLQSAKITGKWLNLCAGDGRFNNHLLSNANEVIAVDIDENALQKLIRITPKTLKNKLSTKAMNVTKPFPFEDNTFDGVFCIGTLHLFPKLIFKNIFDEIERVLKHGGQIIIDFATDIKRTYPDGSLWIVKNEPNYTLKTALAFLKEAFKDYKVNIITDKVNPEKVKLDDKEYIFTSNFILVDAIKK